VDEKRKCSCTTSEADKQEIYNMLRTHSYTQIILGLEIQPNPEPENYSEVVVYIEVTLSSATATAKILKI
jgi:hypothetical protein